MAKLPPWPAVRPGRHRANANFAWNGSHETKDFFGTDIDFFRNSWLNRYHRLEVLVERPEKSESVIREEQYEIWVKNGSKWEMLGSFRDLDIASALAKNASRRLRLIKVTYEHGRMIAQESIAELGITRTESETR